FIEKLFSRVIPWTPNLRGGKTPYSEASFFPPLKPLPVPARLRANALRTQILLFTVIFIQI
ncbi:MAG: hypothetical protein IJM03_10230, partial [Treponema sp.]|nr:hypothetical protein [Treponema sp.]